MVASYQILCCLSFSPCAPHSPSQDLFLITSVKEPSSYQFRRMDACLGLRFPTPLSESSLSSDYSPRKIAVFMLCVWPRYEDGKWRLSRASMPCGSWDFPQFTESWWWDCSVEAALLIIGGFALMTWLSSCWEKVHSSVFLFSALGPALELSPSLPECHITHAPSLPPLRCCLATAVLVPLARWGRDKWITRKTPAL